ncbi:membrane hypothetical protein [Azospirillaceae bacterium]
MIQLKMPDSLCSAASGILHWIDQRSRRSVVSNYVRALVFAFLVNAIVYPSYLIHPELVQDGGINYLKNAIDGSFWTFLAPDAGYLPFIARVISIFVWNVFPESAYVMLSQWACLLLMALFIACLALPEFSIVIPSLRVRYALIGIIAAFPDYEARLLENFVLFSAPFLLWLVLIDKERLRLRPFIILLGASLIVIPSKPHLILFAPIYGGLFLWHSMRHEWRSGFFFATTMISFLVQAYYLVCTRLEGVYWGGDKTATISEYAIGVFTYVYSLLRGIAGGILFWEDIGIYSNIYQDTTLIFLAGIVGLLWVISFIAPVINTRIRENVLVGPFHYIFPFSLLVIFLLSIWLHIVTFSPQLKIFLPYHRYFLLSYIVTLIMVCVGASSLFKRIRLWSLRTCFCLVLSSMMISNIMRAKDPFLDNSKSFSQWKYYHSFVRHPSFGIPVNAVTGQHWLVSSRNTRYLNAATLHGAGFSYPKEVSPGVYELPLAEWNADAIHAIVWHRDAQIAEPAAASLLNADGKVIEIGQRITPAGYDYVYYLFPRHTRSAIAVAFVGGDVTPISGAKLMVIGEIFPRP